MGIYRADISTSTAIVLRHEGEDDHSIQIHAGATGASGSGAYAPVPQFFQDQVTQGKRYYISVSFSEVKDAPAPATAKAAKSAKAAKPTASKKPGKGGAVIAEVEKVAAEVKTAVKKAVKKAPAKAPAKR